MHIIDAYAFVSNTRISIHKDPETNGGAIRRYIEARYMPHRVGNFPGLVGYIFVPVGTAAGITQLDPVLSVGTVFSPMEITSTIVFCLEDVTERKYRLGQSTQIKARGVQVR